MLFGSEEMKEFLRECYNKPEKYHEMHTELFESVKNYAKNKLSHGFDENEMSEGSVRIETNTFKEQDIEDITSETAMQVIKSLDGFIKNIDNNNELQRWAWIRTILYRSVIVFLKRKRKIKEIAGGEIIETSGSGAGLADEIAERSKFEDGMRKTIRVACNAPSKPEKILAYIYNSIIYKEISGNRKNSRTKDACAFMNGKILFELKKEAIKKICNVFAIRVYESDAGPLNDSLGLYEPTDLGFKVFDETEKTVTDWSNRIKTYMYKKRNEFLETDGDSNE